MLHLRVYENPGVRTPHPPLDPSEGRSVPPWRTQPKQQNFLIANSTAVVRDEKRQGTGNCAGFCSSGAQLARSGHSSPPSRKIWGDSMGLRFGSRTKARFYAIRARGVYKHMKRRRRVPFKSCFNLKIHKVSRPIHRRARGGRGDRGTRRALEIVKMQGRPRLRVQSEKLQCASGFSASCL